MQCPSTLTAQLRPSAASPKIAISLSGDPERRNARREEAAGLALPQPRVEAAGAKQRFVRPLLHDPAFVHHHQPVERGDRRKAMRDGDHRLVAHQILQALLDRRLHLRIERRRRLVEDEDRRILQDDAGDGDPLTLAAGKLDAALADMRGVVARARADRSARR